MLWRGKSAARAGIVHQGAPDQLINVTRPTISQLLIAAGRVIVAIIWSAFDVVNVLALLPLATFAVLSKAQLLLEKSGLEAPWPRMLQVVTTGATVLVAGLLVVGQRVPALAGLIAYNWNHRQAPAAVGILKSALLAVGLALLLRVGYVGQMRDFLYSPLVPPPEPTRIEFVPVWGESTTESVRSKPWVYRVGPHETASTIAQAYGVSLRRLQEVNTRANLLAGVRLGQILILPPEGKRCP